MTGARERTAWMFNHLAVLHLREFPDAPRCGTTNQQVESAFAALELMSAKDWEGLFRFAELQRIRLRTMQVVEHLLSSGTLQLKASDLDTATLGDLILNAQNKNDQALAGLQTVVKTLQQKTGFTPVVIKTLDHWPDIGSDLDLFTSAPEADTVSVLREELHAQVEPQSWGDRLAHKWNFRIPELPQLVEIHIGRLGQTGEQRALADHIEHTAIPRNTGEFAFRVPAPEEQVMLAVLQRMYRHFYIRLTDLVNLTRLVREQRLDFARLHNSANRCSIWPGVATLLKITSDYHERYGAGALSLPQSVLHDACFGTDVTYMGEQFLRVPMVPQGSQLFLQQLVRTGAAFDLRAAARLSLFPALAAAAFLNLRLTGSDKGIW